MNETSLSLLDNLRRSPESDSWQRLIELYSPLIRTWLHRYKVQNSDAEDLLQETLFAISNDIKEFEHNGRPGAFRAWIKAILLNRLRRFWRARDRHSPAGSSDIDQMLAQLEDPASEMSHLWDREHDQFVLKQLLALTEPHFAPTTWKAFAQVTLKGENPQQVAQQLGISINAVGLAKSRVIRRLRQESAGLIEASSGFFGKC